MLFSRVEWKRQTDWSSTIHDTAAAQLINSELRKTICNDFGIAVTHCNCLHKIFFLWFPATKRQNTTYLFANGTICFIHSTEYWRMVGIAEIALSHSTYYFLNLLQYLQFTSAVVTIQSDVMMRLFQLIMMRCSCCLQLQQVTSQECNFCTVISPDHSTIYAATYSFMLYDHVCVAISKWSKWINRRE